MQAVSRAPLNKALEVTCMRCWYLSSQGLSALPENVTTIFLAFAAVMFSTYASVAYGQTVTADHVKQALADTKPLLRKALPSKHHSLFDSISFEVADAGFVPHAAMSKDGQRRIVVPVLSFWLMDQLVNTRLLTQALGLKGADQSYRHYLANQLKPAKIPSSGSGTISLRPFQLYAKLPEDTYRSVYTTSLTDARINRTMLIFAFVVAHEVGHHVLGHGGTFSKIKEDEADAYAAELGARAGFNPFYVTDFFLLDEVLVETGAISSAYSHSRCRIARFGAVGGRVALSNPEWRRQLKADGKLDSAARQQKLHEQYLRDHCAS